MATVILQLSIRICKSPGIWQRQGNQGGDHASPLFNEIHLCKIQGKLIFFCYIYVSFVFPAHPAFRHHLSFPCRSSRVILCSGHSIKLQDIRVRPRLARKRRTVLFVLCHFCMFWDKREGKAIIRKSRHICIKHNYLNNLHSKRNPHKWHDLCLSRFRQT